MTEDPIICGCHNIYKSTIANAIKKEGLRTPEQIGEEFGLITECGACMEEVQEILNEVNGK